MLFQQYLSSYDFLLILLQVDLQGEIAGVMFTAIFALIGFEFFMTVLRVKNLRSIILGYKYVVFKTVETAHNIVLKRKERK